MINTIDIARLFQVECRNRILFCKEHIGVLEFHDVGYELASLLNNDEEQLKCSITYKTIFERSSYNKDIGTYLAIENIGILFEPELKIDVRSLIDSYSKNQILIINTDAEIRDGKLFFMSVSDSVCISLDGLSFFQIS